MAAIGAAVRPLVDAAVAAVGGGGGGGGAAAGDVCEDGSLVMQLIGTVASSLLFGFFILLDVFRMHTYSI